MSLLSLAALLIGIWQNAKLSMESWVWVWLFVFLAFACPIVAIPLYTIYPTKWSSLLSYLGTAAQVFTILQLRFTVNTKDKKHGNEDKKHK